MSGRVLVVTNDFPPVLGGIEAFAASLTGDVARRLPPGSVTVLTRAVPPSRPGASGRSRPGSASPTARSDGYGPEGDEGLPFRVVRLPVRTVLPTPGTARAVTRLVHETGADAVWFPSAAPLGLLAGAARRAGARTVVASTHGHEVWWSRTPGARGALRRVAAQVDALTFVSVDMGRRIGAVLPAGDAARMTPLRPGVDADRFAPAPADRAELRAALGVGDAPVVLAVSRLVRRKGVDALLSAWPGVRGAVPGARLVVVGDGPDRDRIARLAARAGGTRAGVHLAGARPWAELPRWYAAADVFALPVRTRLGGLEPEAFGIAYLEAAAGGLPVVAGRSGGTGEALVDGVTGRLVAGRDAAAVAGAVVDFLSAPDRGREWGRRGRAWVRAERTWRASGDRLVELLRRR
ncbi:MAG: glycosyltransferase family 4 protein [Kineosporiaceae bacterium]